MFEFRYILIYSLLFLLLIIEFNKAMLIGDLRSILGIKLNKLKINKSTNHYLIHFFLIVI